MSFKSWVSDLPTTNYKALVSVWLSVIVVIAITTCIVLQIEIQTEALYAVFIFLGGMIGADVTQFVQKRKTEIVTPPQAMAENTSTTTISTTAETPVPRPFGTPHPATDPAIVAAVEMATKPPTRPSD